MRALALASTLFAGALAATGCGKGDTLVVVAVDATAPFGDIAVLRTTATAGGMTVAHDIGASAAPFTIPPQKTFGIQVPSSIDGPFTIHVEARNTNGDAFASGDGAATLAPGERVDLRVVLDRSTGGIVFNGSFVSSGLSGGSGQIELTGQLVWHGVVRGAAGGITLEGWLQ